ncbi:MAG: FAD-binding oxidoreductase, partial [candidate division KSB1 bacterium]|nr:FAD-binding oxidoreductase [candidate division KSB1 bacterium]
MSDRQDRQNPYQPHLARIVRILPQIPDHRLFQLRFEDDEVARNFKHRPGQFVELSVLGTGEAPISISSSPTRPGTLELCVRKVGRVTEALFRLGVDAVIGIRGPYGNGYPVEEMEGHNLLLVAGG